MFDDGDDVAEPLVRRSKIADLADWPAPEAPTAPREALEPVSAVTLEGSRTAAARREFAVLLGEFRRTAVLVPLDAAGDLWSAAQGGVRWICAFSDEEALARFAQARGDAEREWTYQAVLGARLLDVMVPMLPGPAGVALDAGSEDGMLFPPVAGIVPDSVAVDLGGVG
ncbi:MULTISPECIES: SseB family protein [unclassified Streptomyces]|uniref:SseB family protein n=1 Tax=unclassified Streptomyces TaxID=2593676 RepID=UPI00225AA9C5|nr:SseB family protein [Streptomyces sp. NBC_00893]MCX4844649.1 SseB family protein [Streptomyces sp. NBC_00893]